jgi:hypothetical protein
MENILSFVFNANRLSNELEKIKNPHLKIIIMKSTLKTIALLFLIAALPLASLAGGEIRGKITDEMGQPMAGAIIKVLAGNYEVTGTASDFDGKYSIKPIEPGRYDLVITFPQYKMFRLNNVVVINEEAAYVDAEMKTFGADSSEVVVYGVYKKPTLDNSYIDMQTIGAAELAVMATPRGDIKTALAAKSSDVYQDPNDGLLYIRGARKDATQYMIDGEKLIGSMELPATSIESATIITGGIPAQYGDLTGGIVIITTKDYFSGMREKTMWQRDRADRKAQEEVEMKKKADAEKRAKEIEEEKKKAKEEKERKEKELQEKK